MAGGARGDPPFSAAIAEYPAWQPLFRGWEQEVLYHSALKLSGCDSLACLRELPASKVQYLNQAVLNATYPGPGFAFGEYSYGPVIDGTFLKELPSLAFQGGRFYDVPLMVDHER